MPDIRPVGDHYAAVDEDGIVIGTITPNHGGNIGTWQAKRLYPEMWDGTDWNYVPLDHALREAARWSLR